LASKPVLEAIFALEEIFRRNLEPRGGIHINRKVLRHAVENYFLDLERMQTFHSIDLPDKHKRSAFLMVWITKTHPIQLATNANMDEALLVINEIFAIHVGLAELGVRAARCTPGYLRNLVYILHFRTVTPEVLASAMYLLECACLKLDP
jgi:hypothetical protein